MSNSVALNTEQSDLLGRVRKQLAEAKFLMLRYETEFTPCTGITAVTKQERRHFHNSVMIAPWCSRQQRKYDPLVRSSEGDTTKPDLRDTGWSFSVHGKTCRVLATTANGLVPIIYLDVQDRFRGVETPYDTPPEPPENDVVATLRKDSLYFGLAVRELLASVEMASHPFIWAADWETVPALVLLRPYHVVALTLHNTFDECLEKEAREFGDVYADFRRPPGDDGRASGARTALQIGLEAADVKTTVNRGFAIGMVNEPIQSEVMAKHLQHLLSGVVGINNAGFTALSPELDALSNLLEQNLDSGRDRLFALRDEQLAHLPEKIRRVASGKAILVSMGRRVSQKLHDVLVESLRKLLNEAATFPLLAVFATVHGDATSPAVLGRIRALEAEFPSNVVCEDGQLPYYNQLMAAADFNCMPSLYEPHGGAFQGTVIPIARAVDGLAEQICALHPAPAARTFNDRWHSADEQPSGFLFRERDPRPQQPAEQFECLLKGTPFNSVFLDMRDALASVLKEAIDVRLRDRDGYARLVGAALRKQKDLSWSKNLDEMLQLIEGAQSRRTLRARPRSAGSTSAIA